MFYGTKQEEGAPLSAQMAFWFSYKGRTKNSNMLNILNKAKEATEQTHIEEIQEVIVT